MKSSVLYIIICLFLTACIVEKNSTYTYTITNQSKHKVLIMLFYQSLVPEEKELQNNESFSKVIFEPVPNPFPYYDSIYVIFDDTVNVVHKKNVDDWFQTTTFIPDSDNCLLNSKRYVITESGETKKGNIHTEVYTITHQDYLDAL